MKKIIKNAFQNCRKKSATYLLTGVGLLSSISILAQNTAPQKEDTFSIFSNPVFSVLFAIIILLLIIIVALGGILKNIAGATKCKNNAEIKNEKILYTISLITLLSLSKSTFAQEVLQAANTSGNMGLRGGLLYILVAFIGFEMIIILVLINSIKLIVKKDKEESVISQKGPSFLDKLNASVAIENEKDILLDHDYDGIKELNNDLPPWWKYGFYLTIIFAVCYLTYFHILGGDLQVARYEKSLVEARLAKEAYQKAHGGMINEENVKLITDKAQLADAEKIFKTTCYVCHGMEGQGNTIGPNLTDDYWIHGGSIKNVFSTITNGWPEKGMQSWKSTFSPLQINQLSSYVKALRGTNPPNPKEKQGDLYVEEGLAKAASKGSSSIPLKDSVKLGTK